MSDTADQELRQIIAPVPLPPSGAEPVFIVGSVRSGTSAVVNALTEGARIPGLRESNIASLMQRLTDVVGEFFDNFSDEYLAAKQHHLIARVDPQALQTTIENFFAALYAVHMGGGRWVSKSPDSYLRAPMIRACRRLGEMFPKAKFIFCARRGIENVMSRVRKWPELPFGYHCESWANTFEEWFKLRPELKGRTLEVWQREIALRPETVADDLQRFLDLSPEQRDGILRVFTGPRHEQLQVAQENRDLGLDETPWTGDQRAEFMDWCLPMMQAAGFGLTGRTNVARAPLRVFFPQVPSAVQTRNVRPDRGFVEVGANAFQIHPNDPGQPPAEVRWPAIPLSGESRFVADICINHPEGGPVKFGLRLEKSSNREPVVAGELELRRQGVWERGEVTFAPLEGPHDLVLCTQMADGATTSSFAWAQIRDAQLR